MEPPNKRQKKVLFADSGSEDEGTGGVAVGTEFQLNVNKDYAKRFEYNKRREELVQLENKLGKRPLSKGRPSAADGDEEDEESDSEDSEEEDDAAELVTEALDSEIQATLEAIRAKDPRVYDPDAKFYTSLDNAQTADGAKSETPKAEKPMYLKDYHRRNLLSGQGAVDEDEDVPMTYAQEQADLKRSIVNEMHSTKDAVDDDSDGTEDGGFLVRKETAPVPATSDRPKITEKDVAEADEDPETFLSNFMASRAWVPSSKTKFQLLESDDDEEETKAEQFEEAYNLRFEDPNKLNEVIRTHARDTTSKYSVRREEASGRKRQRELERQKKEAEKQQRDEERARLRKLKIDELEAKIARIKKAAGIKRGDLAEEDWSRFLDEGWDDDKWEKEMKQQFGEDYYAAGEEEESDDAGTTKKRKLKKPKWDDDIDIGDLVPDFDEDAEVDIGLDMEEEDDDDEATKKSKKQHLQDKRDKQRDARRERRKIEQLADKSLELEPALLPGSSRKFGGVFRYRESSPVSFGLTAQDILMADDAQLNQYAGLKKLASFRDADKKKRDHKRLGKKARLREWRKDVFGGEEPPALTAEPAAEADSADVPKKRKKRSKK